MDANSAEFSDKGSTTARVLAGAVGTAFAVQTILSLITLTRDGASAFLIVFSSATALVALFCWWCAWNGVSKKARTRFHYALKGGLIVGSISFLCGFIGPMIFMPDANQGPLIGIFFTGPIGFLVGCILGLVYGWNRIDRASTAHVTSPTPSSPA
jgi:hypothetical protein